MSAPVQSLQPMMTGLPGPCIICGDTNYNLSCGGPAICPKCDCGHFDAATVMTQAKALATLKARAEQAERAVDVLEAALKSLTEDPPATLDEPDEDWEVIVKMRAIARAALESKP